MDYSDLQSPSCIPPILTEDTIPNLKAPADKALCVIIRHAGFSGYAPVWLDAKMVSGTNKGTLTSFEVVPGSHLVMSKINLMAKTKLNLEAGEIYYIMQGSLSYSHGWNRDIPHTNATV